ncbi:radical SAM family heme chaperone HemW [Oceanicoccus sagamiensis]|uniref:Heme chaperone HemW n=1 Tax=Oceanicoccus sagamiensis TaxID=716816 RepID=A0A1X9N6D8_9GAMM|nr:radical SAM family heme chaperone HemW [Oceanicoccus sagamiensis]ARN73670.1 YggW family oxidoreductase [Oceanicoccus sagamiensis]
MIELPPLSLYIHIPWCIRKCPYCDFNSHTSDAIPELDYARALIADLEQELSLVQNRQLHSIFFGGGTPSLFSATTIEYILNEVAKRIPFSADIEITLEANPGTVEQEKFSGYAAAGVNRLSIGVQSFNPDHLKSLGRIHNNTEAIKAAATAKQAGIDNVNIDLMHGLPQQNQQQALDDIQQAIDLEPSHISWYQLTIEPNTAFYNTPPTLPSDDKLADIQYAGEQHLQQHAYYQYEISAYSLQGKQSQHNINYWSFGDYIGIGAGAHGKQTDIAQQTILRRWKTRAPKDFLNAKKAFMAGERILEQQEIPLEFMMNSLRLNQGFTPQMFEHRTGLSLDVITAQLNALTQRGLLEKTGDDIYPTAVGRRFLNTLLEAF